MVNIFGGIVDCSIVASGITSAYKRINLKVPVIVRLEGKTVVSMNGPLGTALIKKKFLWFLNHLPNSSLNETLIDHKLDCSRMGFHSMKPGTVSYSKVQLGYEIEIETHDFTVMSQTSCYLLLFSIKAHRLLIRLPVNHKQKYNLKFLCL